MLPILVLFWNWIMESSKWKKRQDAGDREAEVAQEEPPGADPDPGNVLEEDDVVDPAAGNANVLAAEEGADVPLLAKEEGEDVLKFQVKNNKYFCQHSLMFLRDGTQNSF